MAKGRSLVDLRCRLFDFNEVKTFDNQRNATQISDMDSNRPRPASQPSVASNESSRMVKGGGTDHAVIKRSENAGG